jgi:hypothetical protein
MDFPSSVLLCGMFGFTAAPCRSCLAQGHAVWRSVFCGLSCTLAKEFGGAARLLVNRDGTLLGLLGVAMDPRDSPSREKTCCNPLARPYPIIDSHPALAHAAAVSLCGLLAKLEDDARDERGWRGGLARLGQRALDSPAGRAIQWLNSHGFPTAEVVTALDRQSRLEAESSAYPEAPTTLAFSHIFRHLAVITGQPAGAETLTRIGASLGTLIYWKDAWDDQGEDAKRKRFNALQHLGHETAKPRIVGAWEEFSSGLKELPLHRHGEWIHGVHAATAAKHRDFLAMETDTPAKIRRKGRSERNKSHCLDDCCNACDFASCCCQSSKVGRTGGSGCCDALIDCGPGDKGCCDCNPCDGGCCCCGN